MPGAAPPVDAGQDAWLRFELWGGLGVHNGLTSHVFREAARVEPLFNRSAEWRAWWTSASRAPALDLGIAVVWPDRTPPDDWFLPERVVRGRKQHFVRLHVDAGRVQQVPKGARHELLLPAVLEALTRLVVTLRLSDPPTDLPAGVLPTVQRSVPNGTA